MSNHTAHHTRDLGSIDPGRSRHAGRRSAVAIGDETVVGTPNGNLRAFERGPSLAERWHADSGTASVVAALPFDVGVAVGERGPDGEIRLHESGEPDGESVDGDGGESDEGDVRWRYRTADDVGDPQKESRFLLPFVASLATDGDRLYAAARRYERQDGDRQFRSVVYAFEGNGDVVWRYRTDASPIAVETDGERVAVAYNRCPGDHQEGLVVLDADDGAARWTWDPGTEGQRRVGDVSLRGEQVAVASHGDYCGYLLEAGKECWRIPLATPQTVDGDTVYAYPNHVHATAEGVLFVTGNTYPEEGRETDARHPDEHTVSAVADGEPVWQEPVGGFVTALGTDGTTVAVPCAQHFRDRDPEGHGLTVFDVASGPRERVDTEGVVTAAAVSEGTVAAVEEPVVYHDEGVERGAYRLHGFSL